jgi:hypothetical protein
MVKDVPPREAKKFLDEHHIQGGSTGGSLHLGLYFEGELVGVMAGGKHHRRVAGGFVLKRLCFRGGTTVVGGASKLFKRFVERVVALGYSRVVSWSDDRWSVGNVYKQLGFRLEEQLRPDYSYVDGNRPSRRMPKQSMQRKHLVKMGGDPALTEHQMAESLGFYRIYDCGHQRWVWTPSF